MKIFSILVLVFLMVACKKTPDPVFGYDYFPMKEGQYVSYNVLFVKHDAELDPQHDTTRYVLKTRVGELFEDNEGRMAHKFYRERYNFDTGDLIDKRVWTRIIDGGRGEVVEENQRKIRLVFAPTLDKIWDVNAFNTEKEENVYYSAIHTEKKIMNYTFDSTLTVQYDSLLSLIDYVNKYEVYAKGVGLVKRNFKNLEIQNFDTTAIQKGEELHYELIEYGVN